MSLKKYLERRSFNRTPEPTGAVDRQGSGLLNFVVHKHEASHLHYDLRLELDGVLKSWAVPKGPSMNPKDKRLAMMVEDHPFDYRTFEGIIPEGNYGAGAVMIWDRGTYRAEDAQNSAENKELLERGLQKGHLKFVLEGRRLKGAFSLVKMRTRQENAWLLIKKNDEFAGGDDGAGPEDRSVASGRTMREIANDLPDLPELEKAPRRPMPVHVKPMLATLVDKPFDRKNWIFEIKWDGYRMLAEIKAGKVRFYSRNDKTMNDRFPLVVESLSALPFDALLDGELVVVDESGKADFQRLQNYLRSGQGNLIYYVFDLLYLDGHDLRTLPLRRRKELLKRVLPELPYIRISEHIDDKGTDLFGAVVKNDIEGVMAKDADSPYRAGARVRDWLKIKAYQEQEAIIAGFTQPRGGRKGFGALVLGVYRNDELIYIGHAGGGFTDQEISFLHPKLQGMATKTPPFRHVPKTNTPVTWVEPLVVCRVRFTEWTKEGLMRHPVYLGLQEEADPKRIRREQPDKILPAAPGPSLMKTAGFALVNDRRVHIKNRDKVFWPNTGYTKGDLIEYYREIAPFILPYLKNRAESLNRHPDGIEGENFFQKNLNHRLPSWVNTIRIRSESDGREINYLICNDEATLVYMANLGCIEINPWHSRVESLDRPDYMVLDIDPLDVPFQQVVEAALATKMILDDLGISGFCKTSGATGLHVYVPLAARYDYDQVRKFAQLLNALVHTTLPGTTSIERNPAKRKGKVYLDSLQNGPGQTLAAPYCIRPRKGATASTPLHWDEVNKRLKPETFTMKNLPDRLSGIGDIWQGVMGPGIDMEACLDRVKSIPTQR